MNLKTTLLASALTVACGALALAPTAFAAPTGTITINGQVLSSTCSVNGGTSSFTVNLPDVQASALGTTAGTAYTTSATSFSLNLTGCPVNQTAVNVGAQFYSSSNANTTYAGVLNNSLTAGSGVASGVGVELLDGSGNPVTIGTAAPTGNSNVTDQVAVSNTGTATLNYSAQYFTTASSVGAGSLATTVQYVINYQ